MIRLFIISILFYSGQLWSQDAISLKFKVENSTDFEIETFRFYIGVSQDTLAQPEYHLIDLINGKKSLSIPYEANKPTYLMIGTDSTTNVANSFEGDLDPIHGMYWTWNTGFINLKLEGARSNGDRVEWHIGGYIEPYQTNQWIQLSADSKKSKHSITIDMDQLLLATKVSGNTMMRPGKEAKSIFNSFVKSLNVD